MGDNSTNTINEIEKFELEKAIAFRNFEIDLFWKRGWFFGVLLLAIVAGFYTLKSSKEPLFPPVSLAFIGVLTSLIQCLMNRGSKYWQERWEYVTKNRESVIGVALTKTKMFARTERFYIDASILAKEENFLTRCRRFSVSKLAFLVWDIVCLTSILVWMNESINIITFTKVDCGLTIKLSIFYLTLSSYVYFFFKKGKVFEDFMTSEFEGKDVKSESENYVNNRNLKNLE